MQAAVASPPGIGFGELLQRVRSEGLMDQRRGYYAFKMSATLAAVASGWAALFVLGDSWVVMVLAVFIGLASTQAVFIGHDAGHHQIFATRRANRAAGLLIGNLLNGLSFGWWVPKHGAHHAHPNTEHQDPDIAGGVVAFTAAHARSRSGVAAWVARHQGALFFPLLFLEGLGLHVASIQHLRKRDHDASRVVEMVLLSVHFTLYLSALLWVLPPAKALVFVAVQQGVFGFYLGSTFAPNHKGMPILRREEKMDFSYRQVVTARNISGGRLLTFVLGGLDYQIEHHLFPTMPRPNLAKAQPAVKAFCASNHVPYTEASLIDSYRCAVRHLRAIGSGDHADPVPPGVLVGELRARVVGGPSNPCRAR